MKQSEFAIGVDGDVVSMTAATNGIQNIGDNFMGADGEFHCADGFDEMSYAGGLFGNFRKNQAKRQARRDLRTQSKAAARQTKAGAKDKLATAQQMAATASEKGVAADVEMAKALGKSAPKDKGMSTAAKVGIALAVVAVVGVAGYFIYKKMKKGK